MHRGGRVSQPFAADCPECSGSLVLELPSYGFLSRCRNGCNKIEWILKCSTNECGFHMSLCTECTRLEGLHSKLISRGKAKSETKNSSFSFCSVKAFLIICTLIILFFLFYKLSSYSDGNLNVNNLFIKLKKDYPSQKNDTWYHFFGVLEKKIPAVKSIILLHGADRTTADCLSNELVSLFSERKNIKTEEITFTDAAFKGADYGLALEHYRTKVKSFRVFLADLTEISGNMARIFHSLCDDVSSDIKPSLFVFRLRYERQTRSKKPLEKAVSVLKEIWQDLPNNELDPLLSRVVRNVVEVVPEIKPPC